MPYNDSVTEKYAGQPGEVGSGAIPRDARMVEGRDSEILDCVTGLPNDTGLKNSMDRGLPGKWLLILDVGGLRKVNAIYGRKSGDILLTRIRDHVLGEDITDYTLYRMGVGDFGVLFRDVEADREMVRGVAQKLLDRFDSEWEILMGSWRQTIIVPANICIIPADSVCNASAGELYGAIEHTLDIARSTGKIAFYGERAEENYQYKIALELGIKESVRQNMSGFYLAFQPIIEAESTAWSGMEVLCRWDSPDFGAVPPSEFIPIAESCGVIGKIGLWLLEQSIYQAKHWKLDLINGFLLDINLSPFQLTIPDLDKNIIRLLDQYDYPPEKLCLEVTESGSLNFQEHDMEAVRKLSDIGVVIALDDFGSGFASLSVLHKLPVRMLKTDKSFLEGMESDKKLQYLFHAIIELAHNSNMKVVAEGVETSAQAQFLLEQGADYFQGYLFSPPLSASQMEQALHLFRSHPETDTPMRYDRVDVCSPGAGQSYELSPSLYKALYECVRELFFQPGRDSAVETALKYIGRSINVSRSYVFLKDTGGTYSNTHEWCAPGIEPQKKALQRVPVDVEFPTWTRTLITDGILLIPDIRALEPGLFAGLDRQKIKSLVIFPIWRDEELYGFVGFDDCERTRRWAPEEVRALHTLTGIITSTLAKTWMQMEIQELSAKREIILNSLDTAIYVTDPETNEILFANNGLIRMSGNQSIVGRKCWEILEHRTEKCNFCPIERLIETPGKLFQWDHYCEAVKRHLRIRGGIISWTGGKPAYLEYADDITELRDSQNQLKFLASTDMLTLTMNRQSFAESAEAILSTAAADNFPVTLAFIDIDGLKAVNDSLGHAEGDELILNVVDALRRNIRESDALGRFGGDEFVILFPNCDRANASKRLRAALKKLLFISLEKRREYSFSYGLAENTEIPFEGSVGYVNKLIELADKRMFSQKRRNKKRQVQPSA